MRVINGVQAVGGALNARDNLAAGNYGAAALDLVGVAFNSFQMVRPCFPGDVQVLTRRGWVRWDSLTTHDEVLSLPEDEPEGELAYRPVEEVFQCWGRIWEVRVAGRVLRTTAEHPFWVRGRGWTAARGLRVGDALRSHDGQWLAVEGVRDTGREEVVYNCRVAEYHTYFVGDESWGWSVWAHNSYDPTAVAQASSRTGLLYQNPSQIVTTRVGELQAAIPAAQKGRITMAVAVVEDSNGVRFILVSSSEGAYVRGPVRPVILGWGDAKVVGGTGHAEANIITYAQANNLRVIDIGATRPVCVSCQDMINATGANISTSLRPRPSN